MGSSTEPVEPVVAPPPASEATTAHTNAEPTHKMNTEPAHEVNTADPATIDPATTTAHTNTTDTAGTNAEPTQNTDTATEPAHEVNTAPASEATTEELKAQIQKLEEERNVYINDLQRITAEFANFRKRTRKQHADITAQAAARLAESLLPILDAFEAAAAHRVEGIGSIQSQFLNVLNSAGLSAIDAMYQLFDPNKHEAVLTEPGDPGMSSQQQIVTAVLRTGYMWNNKVIRPVMVQVKG